MPAVEFIRRGAAGVILVDNPPVNALSTPVRAGLIAAIAELSADPSVACGVIAATGRGFIAGADIREMGRPPEPPLLPGVIDAIALCDKPLVAALKGAALGGGLEVALACRGRVASRDATIGFPEVKIGLIPGAGGTQMLLRMVDFETAARLVTTGRPISAEDGLKLGLLHRIVDGDPLEEAVAFARALAAGRFGAEAPIAAVLRARPAATPDPAVAAALLAETRKAAKSQRAPMAALELMTLTSRLGFAEGRAEERAVFVHLRASTEAKALRRLFTAEREAGRLPELEGVTPRPMAKVGIVGAGLMGCGIAYAALAAGFPTTIAETDQAALERGKARMAELMDGAARNGRLAADKRGSMGAALRWTTDFTAFSDADLVVEAAYEDMAVKRAVFAKLDATVRPDALLASNTSYLDLDAIAAGTADPSRVLGLHFFSPAHVMRLLEVVKARETAPDALAAGVAFGRKLGKIPVVTGVCEGFCGNRILRAYRIVAEAMVEDGASPAAVDEAMTAFGFPMGPFAVQDMAGLEIAYANRKLRPALRDDGRRLGLVEALVEAGRLGRKNGKGWYAYPEGSRTPHDDPEAADLIAVQRVRREIPQRHFTRAAIQKALLDAMRAEGEAIVREGIVLRPEDVDLVMVHGYGFPPHKGGPMFEG
jgi:3-hydroxyacyl-CoA dehydrogenase